MSDPPYAVLFLCTGNSARSILAEAILHKAGSGRFRAFSAGSHPKGKVHPQAIALLEGLDFDTSDLRSKSWDEFAVAGAPRIDFAITLCDSAANEACPSWPGDPVRAHWAIPDPAAVTGSPAQIEAGFWTAYRMLDRRISRFTELPIASLDRRSLEAKLREIGETQE